MREMRNSQRESQRNIARLMEQINCQQDNDKQMILEGKRANTETPELVHTPEATHIARNKTQRTLEMLSKLTTLFPNQKSLSPSRMLAVIAETALQPNNLTHQPPTQKGRLGGARSSSIGQVSNIKSKQNQQLAASPKQTSTGTNIGLNRLTRTMEGKYFTTPCSVTLATIHRQKRHTNQAAR
jgi:hypothetical protein